MAYFMTYFRRRCFASVCSYNRDTHCSEARLLFKDGEQLIQHAVVSSVSSCCSRPVSDSDQAYLLARMLCAHAVRLYIKRQIRRPHSMAAVTSCTSGARRIEFPVDNISAVIWCRPSGAVCCNGCDTCKTNKTAVTVTTVQRISKFRKDVCCVKGGWCSP